MDELQTAHCVRHRAIDELVLGAMDAGYTQIVSLGAGYEMRATRFRREGVRWWEVDHPATMRAKWSRLGSASRVSREVRTVPLDLERDALDEALAAEAHDPAQPTCFVLEGLIHYLSRARFGALLDAMAARASRRRVILSYIDSDMYHRAPTLFVRLVQLLREVPCLHFTRPELEAVLAAHGLAGFRAWTNAEQIATFAPEASGRPIHLSQDVASAESSS